MKKLLSKAICICAVIVLCLSMCGCGKKAEETDKIGTCTISIECSTILENMDRLDTAVKDYVPKDGIILKERTVDIQKGDSVYDVLKRELKKENILMEASFTGKSVYVEGIDNIYEFSCGGLSGWVFSVNGEVLGTSCGDYLVKDGDSVEWRYTCELGEDLKK